MIDDMMDDLEFEREISKLNGRQLLEFIARESYHTRKTCRAHEARLATLEKERGLGTKVIAAIGAAIGGAVAGATFGIIKLTGGD